MMVRRKYDIGLLFPLKEEFQYAAEIADVGPRHAYDGTFLYEMSLGSRNAIACIIGEMGPLPASHATNRLLSFADVQLLVVLGVAGGLDKDLRLADVVVADEVNEFLAKSKAVETDEGYAFKFSGRHTRLAYSLRETVNHFDVSGGTSLVAWHEAASRDHEAIEAEADLALCNSPPQMHVGSIASGDVVGAAKAFTDQLLAIDRKFLAIDMEAAGVVKTASDRLFPVPVLVVRGISDFADERKKSLDAQGSGIWRRLSVRNATHFLDALLSWSEFLECVGITDGVTEAQEITAECMADTMRGTVGGPWLVGVLFGLHSQSPSLAQSHELLVQDIEKARLTEKELETLLTAVEEIRLAIDDGRMSFSEVISRLGQAIDAYRSTRSVEEVEILEQFDEVILAVLSPTDEEGSSELDETLQRINEMIDDQRFDEAEQMLSVLDERQAPVRALLADLYFARRQYQHVVDLLSSSDADALSRRELEHSISSCYELSLSESATQRVALHARRFNDAAGELFRRNVTSLYPSQGQDSEELR